MIQRQAPLGVHNTIITYADAEYINFTSFDAGTDFLKAGEDVSAGVALVPGEFFDNTQNVICDDTEYITDEFGNVYFKVINYTSIFTSSPSRS